MNNEIKKTSKDYDDNDKKVDETLTKVCNKLNIIRSDDTEEKMLEEESETLCSISLTDEVELSFDGKWLRKYFKLPLKMGIKEIIARKPCDPVTYLGFWLLNYRRCQECRQWQLEKDNELNYLRSMIEEPVCVISRILCVSTFGKTIQEAALRTVSCISAVGSRFPCEVALSPNRAAAPYSLVRG
ncbi:uncharacterized protein LOC117152347 [Bombus impatiens]|uniref:Uncharacterized protein LOC117152347 n=1 Tax=Bombus impatiens TaxID=132113 RepID=A0A6P8M2X4_BOMIM|nr:uncharacterized protein LOC117152347 [Bombus impatiens]